jgi:hypothetical protein
MPFPLRGNLMIFGPLPKPRPGWGKGPVNSLLLFLIWEKYSGTGKLIEVGICFPGMAKCIPLKIMIFCKCSKYRYLSR